MRKFLKTILVLQEVSNKNKNPKIGRGFNTAIRLNPWNPLSYVTIILSVIIGFLKYGFFGYWKEVYIRNPFKWD